MDLLIRVINRTISLKCRDAILQKLFKEIDVKMNLSLFTK